jgi:hypothetical protein
VDAHGEWHREHRLSGLYQNTDRLQAMAHDVFGFVGVALLM